MIQTLTRDQALVFSSRISSSESEAPTRAFFINASIQEIRGQLSRGKYEQNGEPIRVDL